MSREDQRATQALARLLYLHYCQQRGMEPWPAPRVPRWAIDYAEIAVKWYGYTDEAVDEVLQETESMDTALEVA